MNPNQAPQRRTRKAKGNANAKNRSQATSGRQGSARQARVRPPQPKKAGPQTSVAAAYASGQRTGGPSITRTSVDSCRIVHRELIASVTGTVAFAVQQSFPLNPGIAATFPWLSNEALGWERYKFNRLAFCYYTRTGSNVPGSVLLAPDYDAADAAPVTEQAASSYHDTQEDAPWKDIKCITTPSDLLSGEGSKFVRTGTLAANQDIKTYDSGNLHLCTVDGTAVSWGKLWVEYDVTFFTPQTPPGGFPIVGTIASGGTTLAAGTPFGTVPVFAGNVSMGGGASAALVTLANMVVGANYLIQGKVQGTVITSCAINALIGGGASAAGPTARPDLINAGQTSGEGFSTFVPTASVGSFTFAITATTVTSAWVAVFLIPLGAGLV